MIQQLTERYTDGPNWSPAKSIQFQHRPFYYLGRYQDAYQYDIQRRIIRITSRDPDRPTDTYSYYGNLTFDYKENKLIFTNQGISDKNGNWLPNIFTLNERGNIVEGCTYDSNGYLLHRQDGPNATIDQTIQNGNIVKKVYKDASQRRVTTYTYDLTKAGLPTVGSLGEPVYQWGRSSQNLLIKTIETTESLSASGGQRYSEVETNYSYRYDQTGLVNQQTAYTIRTAHPDSDSPLVNSELKITDLKFR
ncbi:hypothetical protein GCM10028818_24230 [Spirosoma horti]